MVNNDRVTQETSVLYQEKEKRTEISVHGTDLRTSLREVMADSRYNEKNDKMKFNKPKTIIKETAF